MIIRSQDKEATTSITDGHGTLLLQSSIDKETGEQNWNISKVDVLTCGDNAGVVMGYYSTKERAVEVLDEATNRLYSNLLYYGFPDDIEEATDSVE